jgi:hypothetical protein
MLSDRIVMNDDGSRSVLERHVRELRKATNWDAEMSQKRPMVKIDSLGSCFRLEGDTVFFLLLSLCASTSCATILNSGKLWLRNCGICFLMFAS